MLFFLSTRFAIYRVKQIITLFENIYSFVFIKGLIDTTDNTIFQLAALVVQSVAGDYAKFVDLKERNELQTLFVCFSLLQVMKQQ